VDDVSSLLSSCIVKADLNPEKTILDTLLDLHNEVSKNGGKFYVAGGYPLSIYSKMKADTEMAFSDVDLWFESEKDFKLTLKAIKKLNQDPYNYETKNAINIDIGAYTFQLIKNPAPLKENILRFDFINAMFFMVYPFEKLHFPKEIYDEHKDDILKHLILNDKDYLKSYQGIARVRKYKNTKQLKLSESDKRAVIENLLDVNNIDLSYILEYEIDDNDDKDEKMQPIEYLKVVYNIFDDGLDFVRTVNDVIGNEIKFPVGKYFGKMLLDEEFIKFSNFHLIGRNVDLITNNELRCALGYIVYSFLTTTGYIPISDDVKRYNEERFKFYRKELSKLFPHYLI
jgi:hypothetical protein